MKLLAISVVLTVHFGGTWRLDVSPLVAVPVPMNGVAAVTLPGIVLYNPRDDMYLLSADGTLVPEAPLPRNPQMQHHEIEHWRQQRALGPWFWAAYALSAGTAFEPHDDLLYSPAQDWAPAWKPTSRDTRAFPLLTVGSAGVGILPGY